MFTMGRREPMPVSQAVRDVVAVAREHAERVDTEGTFPVEAVE